jgi:hypothetical protein
MQGSGNPGMPPAQRNGQMAGKEMVNSERDRRSLRLLHEGHVVAQHARNYTA